MLQNNVLWRTRCVDEAKYCRGWRHQRWLDMARPYPWGNSFKCLLLRKRVWEAGHWTQEPARCSWQMSPYATGISAVALHPGGKEPDLFLPTAALNSCCEHLCCWMTELDWSHIRGYGSIQPPGMVSKDLEVTCGPELGPSVCSDSCRMCSFPSDLWLRLF